MDIKSKIFSKKLWITILSLGIITVLKFLGKLEDLYFSIVLISISVIYLFVEGSIDVRNLKIRTSILEVEDSNKSNLQDKPDKFFKEDNL